MRDFVLLFFLLNFLMISVYSQKIFLKGGYTFSETDVIDNAGESYRDQTEYDWYGKKGFNAGIEAMFPFNNYLGLKTGCIFTEKGFKLEYKESGMLYDIYKIDYLDSHSFNLYSLEIPILCTVDFILKKNLKFQISTGPFLGIALAGKYISITEGDSEYSSFNYYQKIESSIFSEEQDEILFGRFETGLTFGAGIFFRSIFIGMDYDYTILDLAEPIGDPLIRHKTLRLSVGYYFKLRNKS